MDKVTIGIITFLCKNHTGVDEEVDGNGGEFSIKMKPTTNTSHKHLPNSIKIHGLFQNLINLKHDNLCEYIDIHRKHDRITVVMEHYTKSLLDMSPTQLDIDGLLHQLLSGLNFAHKNGIIIRNIHPRNILFKKDNIACLSGFGLFYMTNFGKYVTFPIGYPLYLPMETLHSVHQPSDYYFTNTMKSDVWMLGFCILDWITRFELLDKERNNMAAIIDFFEDIQTNCHSDSLLEFILNQLNIDSLDSLNIPKKTHSIIECCLTLNLADRPSVQEILDRFYDNETEFIVDQIPSFWKDIDVNFDVDQLVKYYLEENEYQGHPLNLIPLKEIFYLWKIAGGNLYNELTNRNVLKTYPPILTLPEMILMDGQTHSSSYLPSDMFEDKVTMISLDNVYQMLKDIECVIYRPIILADDEVPASCIDALNLPKCIKERITVYQLYRMVLFRKLLLEGYPYTGSKIFKEAKIDIPPLYRNLTWAALLDVPINYKEKYDSLDKTTLNPIDRQIDVDIPRCHQYSEIMSSPEAHIKLKRVLKAWVSNQTSLVYWQGLDSLLAPFLSLNMDNEALAHASLEKFVNKFCYNIFIKNNSLVMEEYLFVFFHLLAYHDPKLYIHMKEINFEPELFAIPWFLTMFSHVFPLDKIYHLWDILLLGTSVLPMCFAVAILMILRDKLISSSFNECISIFSNVTGVDVELCMNIGMNIYDKTPPSVAMRNHDNPESFANHDISPQFLQFPDKEPLNMSVLKNENCPRISCKDAIILLYNAILEKLPYIEAEMHSNNVHPSNMVSFLIQRCNSTSSKNFSVLFIDLRTTEEYRAGHLPASINRPLSSLNLEHPFHSIRLPPKTNDKSIIICSNKVSDASIVGSLLVRDQHRYVSVLDIPMHSLAEYSIFIGSN